MSTLFCVRCGREAEPLPKPPLRGPLGIEIQAKVCPACWADWQRTEVMVINELRLNFMDPAAEGILTAQLRQFLCLDGPPGSS